MIAPMHDDVLEPYLAQSLSPINNEENGFRKGKVKWGSMMRLYYLVENRGLEGWNLKGHACVARGSRVVCFGACVTCVCSRPKKSGILF